jgi:hypothetical protein
MREGTIHIDAIDFGNGYTLVKEGDTLIVRRRGTDILLISASTGALTLPSAAGTLATLAGTETLTNKTIDLASNTLAMTSAQLAAAITNETGSGLAVFATSPNLTTPVIGAATGTSLSLTGALAGGPSITPGSGADGAAALDSGVWTNGGIITTRIVVDMTNLIGSTTDLDIIGESAAAANCHIGQITAAVNGTIVGGKVTCLEAPAGGVTDIDFYSATVATGAENALITDLTETALVTSGGVWTSGRTLGMTLNPPANDYLYIVNGAGGVPGTFTAGIFLIELYGT